MINKYGKLAVVHFSRMFLAHLPCCFSTHPPKREFLGIDLTMLFGVKNFGNTSALRFMFFSKCYKFKLNLKNKEKNWEKVSSF